MQHLQTRLCIPRGRVVTALGSIEISGGLNRTSSGFESGEKHTRLRRIDCDKASQLSCRLQGGRSVNLLGIEKGSLEFRDGISTPALAEGSENAEIFPYLSRRGPTAGC